MSEIFVRKLSEMREKCPEIKRPKFFASNVGLGLQNSREFSQLSECLDEAI